LFKPVFFKTFVFFVTLLTKDELKREGILAISYNPEPPWLKP
jgi:hypothetical protein